MAIHFLDIPKEFHSTLTGSPIDHCIDCDCFLLKDGVEYVVEKAVRYYSEYDLENTIFEYAICMDCAGKMMAAMSEDSMKKIGAYFAEHVDLGLRQFKHSKLEEAPEMEELIGTCILKGTPRAENAEYQICAHCVGDKMLLDHMPYMIGMEAMEEVQALLSPETKKEMDGFVGQNFGLPPEWKKALEDRPVVLV